MQIYSFITLLVTLASMVSAASPPTQWGCSAPKTGIKPSPGCEPCNYEASRGSSTNCPGGEMHYVSHSTPTGQCAFAVCVRQQGTSYLTLPINLCAYEYEGGAGCDSYKDKTYAEWTSFDSSGNCMDYTCVVPEKRIIPKPVIPNCNLPRLACNFGTISRVLMTVHNKKCWGQKCNERK